MPESDVPSPSAFESTRMTVGFGGEDLTIQGKGRSKKTIPQQRKLSWKLEGLELPILGLPFLLELAH